MRKRLHLLRLTSIRSLSIPVQDQQWELEGPGGRVSHAKERCQTRKQSPCLSQANTRYRLESRQYRLRVQSPKWHLDRRDEQRLRKRIPGHQRSPTSARSHSWLMPSPQYLESLEQIYLLVSELPQTCVTRRSVLSPLRDNSLALANQQQKRVETHKREL